jgi:hypothetical protein
MTTIRPPAVHAVPVPVSSLHQPSSGCLCQPVIAGVDIADLHRVVYVHRRLDPRDHDERPNPDERANRDPSAEPLIAFVNEWVP